MAVKTSLTQEQKLGQRLSPELRQLSPLLEMNGNELEERIIGELNDNPALEVKEDNADVDINKTEDGETFGETADELQDNDYGDSDDIPSYRLRAQNSSPDDEYRGPVAVAEETLADVLTTQIHEINMSERDYLIADYIIGNIDDNGRLTSDVNTIADDITFYGGMEVEADEVERVLEVVQTLDPPGIAARTDQECLLLQLQREEPSVARDNAIAVVSREYENYAKHRYDQVRTALGLSLRELEQASEVIKKLNPKPGRAYSGNSLADNGNKITPDFLVEIDDDKITVTLPNNIPELQVSESYEIQNEHYAKEPPKSQWAREQAMVVRSQYDRASNFIKLIKMRQEKLLTIMKSIVANQREYFLTGDESTLKPLTQTNVAEETGIDGSVISRATMNKYVDTPWGVFSLKHFFNSGKTTDDGEKINTKLIKNVLREIVDAEDKKNPLSDEEVREKLEQKGYKISRRGVSKYRDQLGIPSARLRKEL